MQKLPALPMSTEDVENALRLIEFSKCKMAAPKISHANIRHSIEFENQKICDIVVPQAQNRTDSAWFMFGDPDYIGLYFSLVSCDTIHCSDCSDGVNFSDRIESILGYKCGLHIFRKISVEHERNIIEAYSLFPHSKMSALGLKRVRVLSNSYGSVNLCSKPEQSDHFTRCLFLYGEKSAVSIDETNRRKP